MTAKTFNINNGTDLWSIIDYIKNVALELGFDKITQARLKTAASEILTNIVKHVGRGICTVRYNKEKIEIIASDKGSGIQDIKKAMEGGHSTVRGSLGMGLAGAKRLVGEFDIQSQPGKGTTVTLREFVPQSVREFEYDGISLPKAGETFNGDAYFIREIEGNKLFVAVIDGGGHGQQAKEKTDLVLKYLEEHFQESLESIIRGCDELLRKRKEKEKREESLVLSLCLISKDKLVYLGVGDTKIKVVESTNQVCPFSQDGILGFSQYLPALKKQEYPLLGEAVIIMSSDGIRSFNKNDLLLDQNPREIANFIMQKYQRGEDDSTVVVVKKKNKSISEQKVNPELAPKKEKEHTQKLKEIKDFLFSVIANAPVGIITINMEKVITVCNAELLRVLDKSMSAEEVINQTINAFLNDLPSFLKAINWSYQKERRSFNMPVIFYRGRYLNVSARKISDGMLIFFYDITDLVQTRSALEQQKEIDKMKTEFLSIAAHQLRTPLGSMRWNIEMLLGGDVGEIPKTTKEVIKQVYESNQRMINLVNDLLNVSKIEQGKMKNKPELTDILKIIKEVIGEMKIEAEKKSISISLMIEKDSLFKVFLDRKRFREVMQNLLSNSIKYNCRGGRVVVGIKSLNGCMQISVRNTGTGIPKKDQTRVFSKFFRASNAVKSETTGSGLGLFVVKSYVESWGGKVWFESVEGRETTFYFTIPMK